MGWKPQGGGSSLVKDTVDTYNDLPITGNNVSDIRVVQDANELYIWSIQASSGALSDWKKLPETLDWSNLVNKPSSSVSDIDDAVNKKHTQNTDTGTDSDSFQLDRENSGVLIKSNSGVLEAKNAADSAYADMKLKDLEVTANLKDGSDSVTLAKLIKSGLGYELHGGGAALTTGYKGGLRVPFDCTILGCYLFVTGTSGSIAVDIWKCSYADYDGGSTHPVDADSITASAVPAISAGTKDADTTLTGWTINLSEGDWLGFNIDSNDTVEQVLAFLDVKKR